MQQSENDVLNALLGRGVNYGVSEVKQLHGHIYHVVMNGEDHPTVILPHSFAYYEKRSHLAPQRPTLIICHTHDTVLPIPVLSTKAGNFAQAFDLPEEITDMAAQRHTKVGSQVLLGAYILGVRLAQTRVNNLPPSTKGRYFQRTKELCTRRRGRPVGVPAKTAS